MRTIRPDKPEMMGWEITRRCNLACPHCYTAATRKALNDLTTAECFGVVDSISKLGVQMIGWTGGEPLLREDLEEIVHYAHGKKIKQSITSNGILFDEARAKSLKKAGVTGMQISIDGTSAELNRRMRRASDEEFEKAMEAVRISVRLRFKTTMAMVIGQENLDDAPNYVRMARKLRVNVIRFCGFVPQGRGKSQKERLLFNNRLGELKAFVSQFAGTERPMVAFDPGFGPLPPDYYFHECTAGKLIFYLSCIGDVYPCTGLVSQEFLVGNVRERSLEDIWNDPKMTEMADFPREKIHGHCSECRYFDRCHGACRGSAFAHTGDLYGSFPVCMKQVRIKKNPSLLVKKSLANLPD